MKKYPPFTSIKLYQATPIVLGNGKVIGWGKDSLKVAKEAKYEK